MSRTLILVDLENEWADENSEYYAGDLSELIRKTNQLIDYCRDEGHKIIFVRHIEPDSVDSFIENSKGTEIFPEIHKLDSDIVITKSKISSFYKTNLEEELSGTEKIVVVGILTNLCVRSLVHDAYDREFDITIIKDCCKAFDEKTHEFTLEDLKATRPEIEVLTLEEFIK